MPIDQKEQSPLPTAALRNRRQFNQTLFLAGLGLAPPVSGAKSVRRQPNIIVILADDLGYGDIGCYGSRINRTPHLDALAGCGMLFTDYHANGPVCTPSRASLLTGLYPHRFGKKFEGPLSEVSDYDDGLPLSAVTIAEVLKKAGYATGMYGKWHLGYKPPLMPANQGFDDFIGLASGDGDHHSHIDRAGRKDWWHNNTLSMERGYSTDLITGHSIDFIKTHRRTPFFLYVAHLSIHFPWQGPEDPPHRREGIAYEADKWGVIPDRSNVAPHVKAMVESLDRGVGRIVQTLKALNLENDTLLLFTSDNGGYVHYGNTHFRISSNGPFRGQKTEVYEGGHRVPLIACLPGRIPAGTRSDETAMTMDLFPTFAELAGAALSQVARPDGISLAEHLQEKKSLPERSLCWKKDRDRAIRKGRWKLCMIKDQGPELYDLTADSSETKNLAAENPDQVRRLAAEYDRWEREVGILSP